MRAEGSISFGDKYPGLYPAEYTVSALINGRKFDAIEIIEYSIYRASSNSIEQTQCNFGIDAAFLQNSC